MQHYLTQTGFLLTRGWRDTPAGITLNFWLNSSQGPIHVLIERQKAVCFIPRRNALKLPGKVERKPLALQSLHNEPVDALYFNQQRDLNQLREHLAYDKTQLLESDIKPPERYLMERFITASLEVSGEATQRDGYLEFKNPVLKTAENKPDLRWVSMDIETQDLRGKLYSIAVTTADSEQVFMVKKYKKQGGCTTGT